MINILLWIVFVFLFILIIAYLYLIYRKLAFDYHQKQKEDWKGKLRPIIHECMRNECIQEIPKKAIALEAAEEILIQYLSVLKNREMRKRVKWIAHQLFCPFYKKRLMNRKWVIRLNTLHYIDIFQFKDFEDDVLTLLHKPFSRKEEAYLIYSILASFQYSGLYNLLCQSKEPLPPFLSKTIMDRLSPELFQEFLHSYSACPPAIQKSIIDVLGNKRELKFVSFMEELLVHQDVELRIRSLKAISKVGILKNETILFDLVLSAHWQERMMVAKVMGVLQNEEFINYLKDLLSDQSWWVRTTAAQSILQFSDGIQILEGIVGNKDIHYDPYAIDMSKEWIARSYEKHGL